MKGKKGFSDFLSGFAIALLVVLFVRFGAGLVLYIIGSFNLPTQVLIIYTSIFYGMVFFIAKAFVHVKYHRFRAITTEDNHLDETETQSKKSPIMSGVRTFLWVVFGAFSVLWLTPALIIYWSSPIYPDKIITILALIFSLALAAIYFAVKNERFYHIIDRLLFLGGTCLGLIIAGWIIS